MPTLDRYERRAHLAPALVTAIPGVALLFTGGLSAATTGGPVAIVLGAAVIVVCGVVRDRGKALEPELWESWGGPPTTRLLRWRDADDVDELAALHAQVQVIAGLELPTAACEAQDPQAADRRYVRAVKSLRSLTSKDDEFPLLKTENANYGWRRNLFGLRPLGLKISRLVLVASVILGVVGEQPRYIVPAAVAIIVALGWHRLDGNWVRQAADRYADQLFATVETLRRDRRDPDLTQV